MVSVRWRGGAREAVGHSMVKCLPRKCAGPRVNLKNGRARPRTAVFSGIDARRLWAMLIRSGLTAMILVRGGGVSCV